MEDTLVQSSAARKPWVAGVLSLVVPGLGQFYSGHWRRGAAAHVLLWIGIASWVAISVWIDSPFVRISTFGLLLSLYVANVADAIGLARRSPRPYSLRPYNRPIVYVGISLVVGFILHPLLKSQIEAHIARPYVTPSNMMSPALLAGDYLYSTPFRAEEVARGSIVVFRENGVDYIQRAIGLPGDTIEMSEKRVRVNGTELVEPYVWHIDPRSDPRDPMMDWQKEYATTPGVQTEPSTRDNWGPIAIPPGKYLVLGDNRDNSFDGRYRGLVSAEQIVGRPAWVYFSREPDGGPIRLARIGKSIR